jgi:hypothetical protein
VRRENIFMQDAAASLAARTNLFLEAPEPATVKQTRFGRFSSAIC